MALLMFLAAASLFHPGCSPADTMGQVTGTITVAGKPLNGGLVRFVTADGKKQGAASIRKDGTYAASVPLGEVKAVVSTAMIEGMAKAAQKGAPVGLPRDFKAVVAPKKYADVKSSGLQYTISTGVNPIDIQLAP